MRGSRTPDIASLIRATTLLADGQSRAYFTSLNLPPSTLIRNADRSS
ncbi:hypothetical protein ACVIGB_008022 [Bradyrhizobium sp. USDA 4341]|uniref:Uncharacterized protein n=1 Tax=Bradyrhizobium erythrophlei TaxID=1437360 RepID=A0A1H4W9T3_9BRAD|nr:hypothetical protein SAMN05444164_3050 [Bradyrhizobium erythrophlei]